MNINTDIESVDQAERFVHLWRVFCERILAKELQTFPNFMDFLDEGLKNL